MSGRGISCSFRNGVSTLRIGFSSHQPRLTEKEKMPLRISLALCLWREVVKVFIRMLWQSSTLMFRRGVCSSSGLLFLSFWMMLLMSVSVPGPAVAFGTQAFHRRRPEADRMVLVFDGVQPQGNDFPASVDGANFVTQGFLDFQYQPRCLNQSNGFSLQERGSNISQFIRFRCFSHIGSRVVTNTGLTKKAFLIVKKNGIM